MRELRSQKWGNPEIISAGRNYQPSKMRLEGQREELMLLDPRGWEYLTKTGSRVGLSVRGASRKENCQCWRCQRNQRGGKKYPDFSLCCIVLQSVSRWLNQSPCGSLGNAACSGQPEEWTWGQKKHISLQPLLLILFFFPFLPSCFGFPRSFCCW